MFIFKHKLTEHKRNLQCKSKYIWALLHHTVVLRMQDVSRRSPERDEKLSFGNCKQNGFRRKIVVWTLIRNAPKVLH